MPTESHKKAQESYEKASKQHGEAHKHYSSGNHEKGAHAAQTAHGHKTEGDKYASEASMEHAKKHGNK